MAAGAVSNVALTDTFNAWRVITNELADRTANTANAVSTTVAAATFTGGVGIAKAVHIGEDLTVGSNVIFSSTSESTTTSTGALVVSGGVGIASNLNIGGDIDITGDTSIGTNSTNVVNFNGSLNTDITLASNNTLNLGTSSQILANVYTNQIVVTTNVAATNVNVGGYVGANTTSYIRIPEGATSARPSTTVADRSLLRFNSDKNLLEIYNGTGWLGVSPQDDDQDTKITFEDSIGGDQDTIKFFVGGEVSEVMTTNSTNFTIQTINAHISTTTNATTNATGALVVSGGVGIAKDVIVGQQLKIESTSNSSSNTTGALIVSGGAGIAKSVTIGEDLTVHGSLTLLGESSTIDTTNLTVDDNLIVLDKNANTSTNLTGVDSGILFNRGSSSNTAFVYSSGEFALVQTSSDDETTGQVVRTDFIDLSAGQVKVKKYANSTNIVTYFEALTTGTLINAHANLNSTLYVAGDTDFKSTTDASSTNAAVDLTGGLLVRKQLYVTANTTLAANTTISGNNISFNSKNISANNSHLNIDQRDILLSSGNRLQYQGDSYSNSTATFLGKFNSDGRLVPVQFGVYNSSGTLVL